MSQEYIPKHVAIIMDGNGRWAKNRNLPRTQGHVEGMRRVEELIEYAQDRGIKVITLFTFSTENWRRPDAEIGVLMNLISTALEKKLKNLKANNVRFLMIGREDRIPKPVLNVLHRAIEETRDNTGIIMNLAFNYGSRNEILDAIRNVTRDAIDGKIAISDISEEMFGQYLYTKDLPDPDLLIRTSGERRISNFLLWQLSYAEFYFTDKFWPDFVIEEFENALKDFASRERRFGNLGGTSNGGQ